MFSYFYNSIGDKSFNYYDLYLANDRIRNNEGVEYLDIKLSPVVIHKIKSRVSCYPAKNYTEYRFIDKNTSLKIVNGERKYYRQHTFDTLTHEAPGGNLTWVIGKTQTDTISSTQFPSKDKYHEITSNTTEYSVSDTVTLYIRNDSRVYIRIKKDDYIDTTIDTLKLLVGEITGSDGN